MRLGVWTPLPHTIRREPRMANAIAELQTREVGPEGDAAFLFASDVIRRADSLGFDTTLVAARHLGPDPDAWILATALAVQTKRIEIMVAAHPGIFHPQLVAKMGATLDRVSSGRFAMNVVNGWWPEEFNIYGNGGWLAEADHRYRRMNEFVQVVKGLWTEDEFSFVGEFYRLDKASLPTKPVTRPNPPIYTATRAEPGLDVVAEYCDYWFVPQAGDFRAFDDLCARVSKAMAEMNARSAKFGRRIKFAIDAHVICESKQEDAEAIAEQVAENGKKSQLEAVPSFGLGACLVGTRELIVERLHRLREIGIDCAMLHFHPMLEGLDRFAEQILPFLEWRSANR
jgi:FMNH2-dependent dimethyl sulfone monooxygenase